MPMISGGPFPASAPGADGGNAAYQVMLHNANRASLTTLAESTVQVTPTDSFVRQTPGAPAVLTKPGLDNYFRYAEQDIAQFDSNKDGVLDESELRKGFGGGPNANWTDQYNAAVQARNMVQAIGQNNVINPVQMTSYLLFQDAPKQAMTGLGYDGWMNKAQQLYQQHYDRFYPGQKLPDMAWDGKLTPAERAVADKFIQNDQTRPAASFAMKTLQSQLQLGNNYQQYRARNWQWQFQQAQASGTDNLKAKL